jgi:ATP-dependent DNA helicase RecG
MPASFSPLDRDAQFLRGVGPRRAKFLERMGVRTARDLLYHTPRRYEDASTVARIGTLQAGMEATVAGRVVSKGVLPTRKGLRIFQTVLRDRSGLIECAWPGQPFLDRVIKRGDLLLVTGPVRFFHGIQLHPREFTVLAGEDEVTTVGDGVVFPIYPATEGLTHRQVRQILAESLDELLAACAAEESLPEELRRAAGVPSLDVALEALHRPETLASAEAGRRRLALEELFYLQLIHARAHRDATRSRPGIPMPRRGALVPQLFRSLPFDLTGAQRRVLREIAADMASSFRMNRLLQGDVGSGKTVVALFAALRAVENGYQAALMVPTEILAEQHARTITSLLGEIGVEVQVLTGRMPAAARRRAHTRIAAGQAQLVVGTHAIIQEKVRFARLGLAIIDEQHRFGVRQRLALADMGDNPDVLVMSATPIPRSLALTLYGDLDISILDERPPNRRPIRTGIRRPADRAAALDFVRAQVGEGRQAYFVYPLVEESESLDLRAATDEFEKLRREDFPDLRLALLHGQMSADAKDAAMRSFAAGEIDILVATTVIEVGIDVANATVMVIEHAERFGLSQLHQLRGRVGRGAADSYCILISAAGEAIERLRIFASTEDGFRIAEADLRIRGQGDLFGARQSGLPAFRWANLETDLDLLTLARDAARDIVEHDPELEENVAIRAGLERGYAERVGMFGTG